MSDWARDYEIGAIRKLLPAAWNPDDVPRFCMDHRAFRPACNEFGPGQGKDDMVDRLLTYADQQQLLSELLAHIQQENPRQYERFAPYWIESAAARPAGPAGRAPATGRLGRWPVVAGLLGVAALAAIMWAVIEVLNRGGTAAGTTATVEAAGATAVPAMPTAVPVTPSPVPFNYRMALKMMYGDDALVYVDEQDQQAYATWLAGEGDVDPLLLDWQDSGLMQSTVWYALPFWQKETFKYLVITATAAEEQVICHNCAPTIGGGIFAWRDGAWHLEVARKNIISLGEWGVAPEAQLFAIGPDRHGVLFEPVYEGQGYLRRRAVLIANVDNTLVVVLDVQTEGDNEAAGYGPEWDEPCYSYSSDLRVVPGQNPGYYDIKIRMYGTRDEGAESVQFSEETVYVFDGIKYEPRP